MTRRIITITATSLSQPARRVRPDQPAYLRTRRVAALAAGNCFECCIRPRALGKDGMTKLRRCQVCIDRNFESHAAHIADGGCRSCSDKAVPGLSRCAPCAESHRAHMESVRRAAGIKPRAAAVRPRVRRPSKPRPPKIVLSTSQVPPALPAIPAPADPSPVEVDLSNRRQVIAALAQRRAA